MSRKAGGRDISDQQDSGDDVDVDVDIDIVIDESALIDDIGKVVDIVEGVVQVNKRRRHEAEKLKAKSLTGGIARLHAALYFSVAWMVKYDTYRDPNHRVGQLTRYGRATRCSQGL